MIDRLLVGNVIKDFGTLDEKNIGIGKTRHSALLVEKYGQLFFVIKFSGWALFGGSVSYQKFRLDDAARLREYISQSETLAESFPAASYDVSKTALRNALITMAVVSVINVLSPEAGIIFLVTLLAAAIHINQYFEFKDHPGVNSITKRYLVIIPLVTLLVGIAKFSWLGMALLRLR